MPRFQRFNGFRYIGPCSILRQNGTHGDFKRRIAGPPMRGAIMVRKQLVNLFQSFLHVLNGGYLLDKGFIYLGRTPSILFYLEQSAGGQYSKTTPPFRIGRCDIVARRQI